MQLRELLERKFSSWSRRYKSTWSSVLYGIRPDPGSVPGNLWVGDDVPLIPRPHYFSNPPSWNQFHTMRALDRVRPAQVKVVILGQDPYPRRRQATGRGFEQGDFQWWDSEVAYGMRHILQRLVHYRTGNFRYIRNDDAWRYVQEDSWPNEPDVPWPVKRLYDDWEDQGVIFLNMVLTYTLPKHVFEGHGEFWKPVVTAILRYLALRPSKRVVFAFWGRKPERFFYRARILQAAQSAGTAGNIRVLRNYHPSARPWNYGWAPPFLRGPNPFSEINRQLVGLGESEIEW